MLWLVFTMFVFCALSERSTLTGATTLSDRLSCNSKDVAPSTRVNTTERLRPFRRALADLMVNNRSIEAFIVYSQDAHNSEYPTEHDQRRAFISGFEGSAGTAVITQTSAALWTDGRYHLEAEETLDCNWILMKSGLTNTPTIVQWLNSENISDGGYVGVDRTLITHTSFRTLSEQLQQLSKKLELQPVESNPVDTAWGSNQTEQPKKDINALSLTFAGVSWQKKIENLRTNLTSKGAFAFAVTALDEIAWLFNLRGSDISYNPFFLSYAIVEQNKTSLYIINKTARLSAQTSDSETNVTLADHLGTSNTGSCAGKTNPCVEVLEYNQTEVERALSSIAQTNKVLITYEANQAIYLASKENQIVDKSPIALQKSQKNEVERNGMQRSYDRDSATLVKFLAFLENEIQSGKHWTEVSAATELDKRRNNAQYNRGLSFETISGYGSNGAIIHYRPAAATDKVISTDNLYLLDSGGQYLDGTTDVTRTMHYGNPTSYQKECYTRVLMASINLALLKWPQGLYGRQIDAIARAPLWEAGLVYRHGTGHGIGAYLSVHEGPGSIGLSTSSNPSSEYLYPYQYYSDEPGYYEDGQFGIRLETIVMVSPHKPKYVTANDEFYEFQPITFVPFETNLIDFSLLNEKQVEWLNFYNQKTQEHILPLLKGDQTAIDWTNARTKKINFGTSTSSSVKQGHFLPFLLWTTLLTTCFALIA